MLISFASIAREHAPMARARRQPSHVPAWVLAEEIGRAHV